MVPLSVLGSHDVSVQVSEQLVSILLGWFVVGN